MNELADILTSVELKAEARFFSFGEWPDLTTPLAAKGWRGIIVSNSCGPITPPPETLEEAEVSVMTVQALVKLDPHLVRVASDVLVRPVTPIEVLGIFSGPWRFGLVNVPGLSREIACCDAIWSAWPNILVVKHDGQEHHITNLCAEHGYTPKRLTRDALVLERPLQKGE